MKIVAFAFASFARFVAGAILLGTALIHYEGADRWTMFGVGMLLMGCWRWERPANECE